MKIFVEGSLLLLGAFLLHLLLWKINLPKRQLRTLLIVFGVTFCVWLAGSVALRPIEIVTMLHIALFYWSAALCYVITYSTIEADSPTLTLTRFVADAGGRGRSKEEVAELMAQRPFVRARLEALLQSNLIREQNGRYFGGGGQPLSFQVILGFRKLFGPIAKGG